MSSEIAKAKAKVDKITWEVKSNIEMRDKIVKHMDGLIDDGLSRLDLAKRALNDLDLGVPYNGK